MSVRTNSSYTPSCFTDNIADEVDLNKEEKELILTTHRWLSAYHQYNKPETSVPTPHGTRYEAWAMLSMAYMLSGFTMFPMQQVRETVPTPPDFITRVGALAQKLETKLEK